MMSVCLGVSSFIKSCLKKSVHPSDEGAPRKRVRFVEGVALNQIREFSKALEEQQEQILTSKTKRMRPISSRMGDWNRLISIAENYDTYAARDLLSKVEYSSDEIGFAVYKAANRRNPDVLELLLAHGEVPFHYLQDAVLTAGLNGDIESLRHLFAYTTADGKYVSEGLKDVNLSKVLDWIVATHNLPLIELFLEHMTHAHKVNLWPVARLALLMQNKDLLDQIPFKSNPATYFLSLKFAVEQKDLELIATVQSKCPRIHDPEGIVSRFIINAYSEADLNLFTYFSGYSFKDLRKQILAIASSEANADFIENFFFEERDEEILKMIFELASKSPNTIKKPVLQPDEFSKSCLYYLTLTNRQKKNLYKQLLIERRDSLILDMLLLEEQGDLHCFVIDHATRVGKQDLVRKIEAIGLDYVSLSQEKSDEMSQLIEQGDFDGIQDMLDPINPSTYFFILDICFEDANFSFIDTIHASQGISEAYGYDIVKSIKAGQIDRVYQVLSHTQFAGNNIDQKYLKIALRIALLKYEYELIDQLFEYADESTANAAREFEEVVGRV